MNKESDQKKQEKELVPKENSEVGTNVDKGELERIKKISLPKEQAKEEWRKYNKILKERQDKFLKVMKESMYHIKEGRNLIDVYEAIGKAGLNEKKEPRLAISRADLREIIFRKTDEGSGSFNMNGTINGYKDDVGLPQKTFDIHWKREDGAEENSWRIDKKILKTKVPIIPIQLVPEGKLENYYILWEVKEWEELPEAKKDPFLLKRVSENLFAILGAWEVTELEQAVIRGLQ